MHYIRIALLLLPCALLAQPSPAYTPYADPVPQNVPPNTNVTLAPSDPIAGETASAALEWITLIDQHLYDVTWTQAGILLKEIVSRAQWVSALEATRRPLGYNATRKLTSQRLVNQLPLGTPGRFVILKYDSSFQHSVSSVETCIVAPAPYGKWRVIHYDVQ